MMNKDKQIENERYDIARIVAENFHINGEGWDDSDFEWAAHCVQMAGYRKQSGWISVDEALPKPFVSVLAYCPIRCNIYGVYLNARGEWHFFDESAAGALLNVTVSHWMPLPEPPKMKGDDNDA